MFHASTADASVGQEMLPREKCECEALQSLN